MAWLANWNRRKKLNINGTSAGAQSAYQMKITVYYGTGADSAGKIYCSGNVKGDFSDVIFTDTDGTTLLNYWIESFVADSSATIWVKIPTIPTGTNSTYFYIYYNNPVATTSSNGLATFNFFDDFLGTSLDSSKWNIVTISGNAGNSISVSNSNITITADANDGYGICAKTAFSGSQAFETRGYYVLTKPSTGNYLAPVTLLQDNTHHIYDSPSGGGYYCEWATANNTRIVKFTAPNTRPILQQSTTTMTAGSIYNQSLLLDNTKVTWLINGANATSQATDSTYRTSLYAGIQSYKGCKIQVDSVFVRKYASPEPTFGTIGTEELSTGSTGSLFIRSNPIGARVFIDSIDQVVYTPITITGLSPGTHNITLTKAPYSDYNTQVTILAGQTTNLSVPVALGIVNGAFNTDLSNWTNTVPSGGYYTSGYITSWESPGRAHIKSGSTYGASLTVFVTFSQRFYLDKPLLAFDAQALISDDGYGYECGNNLGPSPSGCGWIVTDDSNNVIAYGKPGSTLTTVSIDLTNYINQWLTITFRVGAARYYGYYYDLLIDNVSTAYGTTFRAICADTGQFCNASLYIDNNYTGITPFKTYLNLGTHNYSLFKGGYNRLDTSVNITSTEITAQQTTGMNIDSTLVVGLGGIINGTFDTNLSGWTVTGNALWDNGRVHLTSGGNIYQVFAVTDNALKFDWDTIGWAPSGSGLGYRLYIDDVQKLDVMLPGNYGNHLTGTTTVYLGNYIGRTAKILFYEAYGWEGWIDNVRIYHTTGIFNGGFESGIVGWDSSGSVTTYTCSYWGIDPPCSGNLAVIEGQGTLMQTFIVDKCALKFDWWAWGGDNGYKISIDGSTIISKAFQSSSSGTEIVDLSSYIGNYVTITFYSNWYELDIDNVATITNPYDVSVISYPSGAEIFVDNVDTGQSTGNTPIVVNGGSEGSHMITLRLAGYPDYIETINIVRCVTTYVSATLGGCVTFITNPPGAKICIDNIDTLEVTPKTFCGYGVGSSHTYTLYLKNYRVEKDTIIFPSDKGFLINKTLIYETGSVRFSVTPYGSKIIIDGVDTGIVTPNVVDNLTIGYHTYEIRNENYYSLTGAFRIIVDTEKLIAESLQQITGIVNGTFDTDISGWTVTSSNLAQGYVEWLNGQAHLITNGIPITFSKDFVAVEDSLVFYYDIPVELNTSCSIGWNVIVDPDTPGQTTIASYCGWGEKGYDRYEHWGYFEVDLSQYIGRNIRLNLNLTGTKIFYIGGPAEAYLDNVGNVKPRRSISFNTYCSTIPECPTNSLSITKCFADIYLDNNFIGIDEIIEENLTIGPHSYKVRNQGYSSIDTNNEDVTGSITFLQGIPNHSYIDNIYIPTGIVPPEGCVRFESLPPGLHIFIDGQDTRKVTPDTICNVTYGLSNTLVNTLTAHSYELKLLNSTYQGNFDLGPGFGEYIYVEIYGQIQFDTIPEGARLTLDGVDTGGTTPYNTGNIPIGIHTYKLSLTNFQDQTCQIEVIKDQTATVNLELKSAEGCIYIDSCPRGSNGFNTTDLTIDGVNNGTTPLSICGLTGIHTYTLSRVGYDTYTETIIMPLGIGINRKIYLNRKIGIPFLEPTLEICSINSTRTTFSSPAPYYPDTAYNGKDVFQMQDGGVEIIDAQGYDVIHLHVFYHNFWVGYVEGPISGRIDIYQSNTSGNCTTRPTDAELILSQENGSWNGTLYNSYVLFDGSLNISRRYIRIETSVYMCNPWNCWGDGASAIFVMEQIPIDCPSPATTKCIPIVTCIIKTDEGIYSKDRYCYLGEGIFTKRLTAPPITLVGTNTISQNCGDWGGMQVDCWIGNDGYLVLENQHFSPGWRYSSFEAKGNYIEFYTPGGFWQLYDVTTGVWIVGTGDGYNGAYVSVSGNVSYEIPATNKGHTLQIWFEFPSLNYHYDHIKNILYQ